MNKDNTTYSNNANEILSRRNCAYCKTKQGFIVYCCHTSCRTGFHPLCGRLYNCVLGWDEEKVHSRDSFHNRTAPICYAINTVKRRTNQPTVRSARSQATRTTCCFAMAATRATIPTVSSPLSRAFPRGTGFVSLV